jgi:hypothetical protein
MQAVATSLFPTWGHKDNMQHREGAGMSRLRQVQAGTHTSADIAFVTAEGDKVTLSTDAVAQAVYTRYDARGRLQGQGSERHAETLQWASAKDISLHIEGNLNDAERADMQQALDTLEQLATDFFSGTLDEAPSQALALGNLHTIRSVDATLELSQSLTVSQLTETRGPVDHPPALDLNAAALEAQPSAMQHAKSLLDAIFQAIDATTVVQPEGPSEART